MPRFLKFTRKWRGYFLRMNSFLIKKLFHWVKTSSANSKNTRNGMILFLKSYVYTPSIKNSTRKSP